MFSDVFDYVNKQWLQPCRTKFVSAWINQTLNFHQTTTNRVESQHSELKRHCGSHHNALHKIVGYIHDIVIKQRRLVNKSLEDSLSKVMKHHRDLPILDNLRGHVSHHALNLLDNELHRRLTILRTYDATCGCHLFKSCGLPCACRLERYENTGNT